MFSPFIPKLSLAVTSIGVFELPGATVAESFTAAKTPACTTSSSTVNVTVAVD